ncbi:CLUMA_CG017004, isoform A [Clunio marinus]|uniref:CLUMA_CG017004, isoform A n=1 Tax=Clunio marinus TaxID=568069 RepID=A0A1J1IUU8_9DIPT|nr:CLUMA_CG017004, isoform A [Clunio marinus]
MICLDSKMKVQCYAIILTMAYVASTTLADTSSSNASPEKATGSLSAGIVDAQRVERSPKYDFGLGKRRYIITTGGPGKKRLPHYNFGLGKRSNPYAYNFGLGKRADIDDPSNYDDDTEFYSDSNNYDKAGLNLENWQNGGLMDNKNDIDVIDYDLGYPREYKRSPRPYSFGLGKRRQYDFGLGKRKYSNDEYDTNKRLPNRYNFGLGKR